MDPSAGQSQVRSALEATLCSDPDIVFGSQLSGTPTPLSDLDVAIKFTDELSEQERFEKRCFLSGDLQHEDRPFVDVSDIESLPLAVAHDAVNGEPLCGDEQAFERFRADIEARFDRQRETLRHQQRELIDRIAEDGLRG